MATNGTNGGTNGNGHGSGDNGLPFVSRKHFEQRLNEVQQVFHDKVKELSEAFMTQVTSLHEMCLAREATATPDASQQGKKYISAFTEVALKRLLDIELKFSPFKIGCASSSRIQRKGRNLPIRPQRLKLGRR